LLETLNDTNEIVAATAAYSLAKLGATNTAPALLAKLKARLQSTNTPPEELESQASVIASGTPGEAILDPDNLAWRFGFRVPARAKEMASMRLPPRPLLNLPNHDYTLADALIEALGDLGYTPAADELFKLRGTDYDAEATRSLNKLAPDRLAGDLLATARDKQIDSYVREKALFTLGNLTATNRVRELIPLLDDVAPIVYSRQMPGPEWRICDRAAVTIAVMLGWERRDLLMPMFRPEQREKMMARVREWAKQTP
jgi:HEAT repeat protein